MKIEFYLRTPGQHQKAAEADLPAVPREGDFVSLDGDTAHTVHSVTWDIKANSVQVLLAV